VTPRGSLCTTIWTRYPKPLLNLACREVQELLLAQPIIDFGFALFCLEVSMQQWFFYVEILIQFVFQNSIDVARNIINGAPKILNIGANPLDPLCFKKIWYSLHPKVWRDLQTFIKKMWYTKLKWACLYFNHHNFKVNLYYYYYFIFLIFNFKILPQNF